MKSFGRLLKRLRGTTSLEQLSERTGRTPEELTQIEAGQLAVDEREARQLLKQSFALPRTDVDRLLLGIQLYDLGLKDNELRQLVIALIRKELPTAIQDSLRELYRQANAE
jgi:hypothetical protein